MACRFARYAHKRVRKHAPAADAYGRPRYREFVYILLPLRKRKVELKVPKPRRWMGLKYPRYPQTVFFNALRAPKRHEVLHHTCL